MGKKENTSQQEEVEATQVRQKAKQLLRRRLLGAFALFAATFLLWEFGGVSPPQHIVRDVPPEDKLFPLDEELPAIAVPEMEPLQPFAEAEETHSPFSFDNLLQTDAPEQEPEDSPVQANAGTTITAKAEQDEDESRNMLTETTAIATSASVVVAVAPSRISLPSLAPVPVAETQADVYHIQIGAFSRQARAKEAAAALERHDFNAALLPLLRQDSTLWRVRAVNYATQAAAQQAQAALVQLGYANAQVVKAEEVPAVAASSPVGYRLRVGVYRESVHAQRAAAAIEQAGASVSMQVLHRDGVEMTRVLAAGLPSESEAKNLQKTLQAAGYADTVVEKAEQ